MKFVKQIALSSLSIFIVSCANNIQGITLNNDDYSSNQYNSNSNNISSFKDHKLLFSLKINQNDRNKISINTPFSQTKMSNKNGLNSENNLSVPQNKTQLITIKKDSSVIGYSIISKFEKSENINIDHLESATALIFMNPLIATNDLEQSNSIIKVIKGLNETKQLSSLIEKDFSKGLYLDKPSDQRDQLINNAIAVIFDKFDSDSFFIKSENNIVQGVEINIKSQHNRKLELLIKNHKKRYVNLFFLNKTQKITGLTDISSANQLINFSNFKIGGKASEKSIDIIMPHNTEKIEVVGFGLKDIPAFSSRFAKMSDENKLFYGLTVSKSVLDDFVMPIISIVSGIDITKSYSAQYDQIVNNIDKIEVMKKLLLKDYKGIIKQIFNTTIETMLANNGALLKKTIGDLGINLQQKAFEDMNMAVGIFNLSRKSIETARTLKSYLNSNISDYFIVENKNNIFQIHK